MVSLKDAVLLAGGSSDCDMNHLGADSTNLYFPSLRLFRPTGKMNVPRASSGMTVLDDGRVLVTGGITGKLEVPNSHLTGTDTAEIYDPATGRFTITGKMTSVRAEHIAVLLP
jgi:Kelch motif protein